jgi:hypothetical protein
MKEPFRVGDLVFYLGKEPIELGVFVGYDARSDTKYSLFWNAARGAQTKTITFFSLLKRVPLPEDDR